MRAKERPKGLTVFAVILLLGLLSSLFSLFRPDSTFIYFGKILDGFLFKLYYSGLIIFFAVILIGILKLKRWSYICFAIFTGYYVVTTGFNVFFTKYDTLIEAGWKLTGNSMSSFYISQGFVVFLSIAMFFWFRIYRKNIN